MNSQPGNPLLPDPLPPGCYPLDGTAASRAYGVNRFCHALLVPANRDALKADPAVAMRAAWDEEFLDRLETASESLTALSHRELIERGGTEGSEEIMWLCMRGALASKVRRVHRNYYHASLTGYGQLVLEDMADQTAHADDYNTLNTIGDTA